LGEEFPLVKTVGKKKTARANGKKGGKFLGGQRKGMLPVGYNSRCRQNRPCGKKRVEQPFKKKKLGKRNPRRVQWRGESFNPRSKGVGPEIRVMGKNTRRKKGKGKKKPFWELFSQKGLWPIYSTKKGSKGKSQGAQRTTLTEKGKKKLKANASGKKTVKKETKGIPWRGRGKINITRKTRKK